MNIVYPFVNFPCPFVNMKVKRQKAAGVMITRHGPFIVGGHGLLESAIEVKIVKNIHGLIDGQD